MRFIYRFTLSILFFFSGFANADSITFTTGMEMLSYTLKDQEASATTTAEEVQYFSGSTSLIPIGVQYEKHPSLKMAYYGRATMSFIADRGYGHGSLTAGQSFYFMGNSFPADFKTSTLSMTTSPKFSAYYGWSVALSQFSYPILSGEDIIKANDTVIGFGGNAGANYLFNKKWGAKVHMELMYGFGFKATVFPMIRIFVGPTFYF